MFSLLVTIVYFTTSDAILYPFLYRNMYSVEQLIAGIANECRILKHLASKVDEQTAEHRFSPDQRSIEELEQYLVSSFPAQVLLMVSGNFDQEFYTDYLGRFAEFHHSQFADQMDVTLETITTAITSLTPDQRDEGISFWGRKGPRSMFLVDYVFTFLGSYKMQLFLQLKHAGLTQLNTYNLRGGVDG